MVLKQAGFKTPQTVAIRIGVFKMGVWGERGAWGRKKQQSRFGSAFLLIWAYGGEIEGRKPYII